MGLAVEQPRVNEQEPAVERVVQGIRRAGLGKGGRIPAPAAKLSAVGAAKQLRVRVEELVDRRAEQ